MEFSRWFDGVHAKNKLRRMHAPQRPGGKQTHACCMSTMSTCNENSQDHNPDCLLRFPDPFCMKKHSISPTGPCHQILPLPREVTVPCCSFTVPCFTWLFLWASFPCLTVQLTVLEKSVQRNSTKLLLTNRRTSPARSSQFVELSLWPDQA